MGKKTARRPIRPREAIAIWESGEHQCYWCDGDLTPDQATFDHYEPIARGGEDCAENIVLSCASCNSSKGTLPARVAELWMREGLPRCWSMRIWEFEEGLPASREVFFTGAEWEFDEETGKRRVVELPIAGGQCDDPRCPDCA